MENKKPKILIIAFNLLLVAALIGGVILVGQNQNTRRGAYFSGAKLSVLPEMITANVGDEVPVQLWVNTENNAKVSAVDTEICYGNGLKLEATDNGDSLKSLITLNKEAFDTLIFQKNNTETKCLRLTIISQSIDTADLKSGLVKVANIKFKALASGSGQLKITKSNSIVSGYNPTAGATDTAMSISSVQDSTYTIGGGNVTGTLTPSPSPGATGDEPYLKFKMSFDGVKKTAECASVDKMLLSITVRSQNGTSKTYTGIVPTKTTESTSTGLAIYSVGLPLTGFDYSNNIAIFVKGPKHLQVKYAKDDQTSFYNSAGGELSGLTKNKSTTPVFDFTGYPLLAGDVTGATAGVQDGVINGIDHSYLKAKSDARVSVNSGQYLLSDLDGNCAMSSVDFSLLMSSLGTKQGQMY